MAAAFGRVGAAPRAVLWIAAFLVVLAAATIGVIALSQRVAGSDEPPEVGPFVRPPVTTNAALDVKQRTGDTLILTRQLGETTQQQELTLTPSMKIERLTLATAADVEVGDWVSVIGIQNDVRNFSSHLIVAIPAAIGPGPDGVSRSTAGFAGNEVSRDPRDKPIIGGVVERIEGKDLFLKGPSGNLIITVGPEAPARLYRLSQVDLSDIREGDRVAGDFSKGPPAALLVVAAN